MGLSDNRTPEYMKSFTHIVVVPYDSEIKNGAVYFINTESGSFESAVYYLEESNGLSAEIDSVMSDKDIDIRYISTAVSGFSIFSRNVFVPQFTVSGDSLDGIDEIKCIDLSQASEEYLISQTEQFFSKYTAKTVSFEPSGTYTVSDSTTVVKCYPSGVLEYFSYGGDSSRESQTLSSAYYACVEFLKKDISIKTGYYLSDVRLTGEGLIFCFDYHISGLPVMIGSTIKNDSGIDHAIEVAVVNNNVRKVKKLNANFIPKENAPEQIGVDFLTAVNYAMALNGGADKKIDDIELGYYASGTDSVGVCWFVHIDSTLYIIDAADGSLRIK